MRGQASTRASRWPFQPRSTSRDARVQGCSHSRPKPGAPRTETSLPLRRALALGASAAVSALIALSCTGAAHRTVSSASPDDLPYFS